jgi:hypothetical protein
MTVPTDGRPIGYWLKLVDRLIDKRLEASLELTELGTNEFARLLELVSADRTTLMIGIAPEEYAATVSVLGRMARNLGWTSLEDRPHST